MIMAQLSGFYAPDFVVSGRQRFPVGSIAPGMERAERTVAVADARALQAAQDLSETEFMDRHGFVLLPHPTDVKDWDGEVASVYLPEIDQLVRERLLPGRRVEIGPAPLLRRGRGTAMPFYATGVHSDGGVGLDDHLHNIQAFASEGGASATSATTSRV